MKKTLIAAVLFPAVFAPLLALAHQTGASFETETNGYLVDVGYDPVSPRGGDRLVWDFDIKKKTDGTRVPYDYVWVRIEKDGATYLATGVARAELGPTTLLMQLPDSLEGNLKIDARFQKGETTLAETSNTLSIGKGETSTGWFGFLAAALLGIALGGIGGYLALKRTSRA